MVPDASDKVPRASPYSGFLNEFLTFRIRGSHPFSLAFPHDSTILRLFSHILRSYNPDPKVGLGSFPFARHYLGNRFFFLFLRLLRCFSSPGAPRMTMDSSYDDRCSHLPSSLIRISADQCLLAAPHSFSQLTTSFIGNQCQGILPVLLFA